MRQVVTFFVSFVPLVAFAQMSAADRTTNKNVFARAKLEARSGSSVTGVVEFAKSSEGLEVVASVSGAKTGAHGFHIHEKGDCSAPDATSAGEHFNPTQEKHGGVDGHRHAGDFGNIVVDINGNGTYRTTVAAPKSKQFAGWESIVGKSVIVHASADDMKSQPSGNSGARVACGVIERFDNKRLSE